MIDADKRADALLQHAKYLGAPLDQFAIQLTDQEGLQLLDLTIQLWEANPGQYNVDLLKQDYALAKACGNPWPILADMRYRGLPIERRPGIMQ